MLEHAVLDDHDGGRNLAVTQEQRIVTDAQADDDIEVAAVRGERFRLHDRVAHGLVAAAAVELFLVRHADLGLVHRADLAADGKVIDAACLEDAGEDRGLAHQTDAGGDADFLEAHAPDELDGLLDARQAAVEFAFDAGGGAGDPALKLVISVNLERLVQQIPVNIGRQAERGILILARRAAAESAAVRAAVRALDF